MNQQMKKQCLALSLSVALLSTTVLSALAVSFTDTSNHWAQQDIAKLSDQNVLTGYPDGRFMPYAPVNRAEFSTVLVKALGLNTNASASHSSFMDVPSSFWAYPAIETVKSQGLVSGYPNGLFLPTKSISRVEALVVLANAAKLPMPTDAEASQILSSFRDEMVIPAWARRAVAATVQAGLFENDPSMANMVDPLKSTTRGELAALVNNLRERMPSNMAMQQPAYQQQQTQQAQQNYQQPQQQQAMNNPNMPPAQIQGRVSAVPANTKFTGTLNAPLSSELNRVGDTITMVLDQPLMSAEGMMVVPQGSQIVGKVVMVDPAARLSKSATLDVDFTELITPDGQRYQIQGSVATEDGMLRGDSTKGRILKAVGKTALGAGAGAALGTAMGPLSGGGVGKGAIYGTAIGAGAGAITAAAQKGKPVIISTGDRIEVKLDQPIIMTQPAMQQPMMN